MRLIMWSLFFNKHRIVDLIAAKFFKASHYSLHPQYQCPHADLPEQYTILSEMVSILQGATINFLYLTIPTFSLTLFDQLFGS